MKKKSSFNKNGFTMAELLIVVAIIAVLVAIAIPIFNKQLEKSREAYDIHMMRTVASAAQDFYYAGVHDKASANAAGMGWYGSGKNADAFAVYDPSSGKFYPSWESYVDAGGKGYGKGTTTDGGTNVKDNNGNKMYTSTADYTKCGCQVRILPNADKPRIEVQWKTAKRNQSERKFVDGKYIIYLD